MVGLYAEDSIMEPIATRPSFAKKRAIAGHPEYQLNDRTNKAHALSKTESSKTNWLFTLFINSVNCGLTEAVSTREFCSNT